MHPLDMESISKCWFCFD